MISDTELKSQKVREHAGSQRRCQGAVNRLHSVKSDEASKVSLTIISFPVAADVEVDGVFYGSAGERIWVPCGMRHIWVGLPGYGVWEKRLILHQDTPMTVRARLRKSADFRIINE